MGSWSTLLSCFPGSDHYLLSSFLGFSLYVSNTTDISEGTLCFKDNHFTVTTIPSVFTGVCPVHGQYVIYHNERLKGVTYSSGYSSEALIKLCEVEVYGKCTLYCKSYAMCVFPPEFEFQIKHQYHVLTVYIHINKWIFFSFNILKKKKVKYINYGYCRSACRKEETIFSAYIC